jgi:DNA-binding LacI/PurR family transcriptional regulator/DNA-binding transcriptional regulator YhcF (GntR family)
MKPIDCAYSFIQTNLASGKWLPGQRLPSTATLAGICMVSRSTMARTLARLKEEKLIHINPRGAIYAGTHATPVIPTTPAEHIWQRLAQKLRQDLLQGNLTNTQLSAVSALAKKYGTTLRTLRKALRALADESLLVQNGRKFVYASPKEKHATSSVVLIAHGSPAGIIPTSDPRVYKTIESYEQECNRFGRDVFALGYDDRNPKSLLTITTQIKAIATVSGFILSFWNPVEASLQRRWFDLLDQLVKYMVPIVIIDLAMNVLLPGHLLRNPRIRILRPASVTAGTAVANTLIGRGHRSIAFVSSTFGLPWTIQRFQGAQRAIGNYGSTTLNLELHMRNSIADLSDIMHEYLGLSCNELSDLYRERYTSEILSAIIDSQERIEKSPQLALDAANPEFSAIRTEAAHLVAMARQPHDTLVLDRLLTVLIDRASTAALETYLAPLFEQALEQSKSTAWIISDDKTAIMALSFLNRKGKKVPADISLVSFDNWPDAFVAGLSSYDFNYAGLSQLAMLMIIDKKTFAEKEKITEMDGYMVERKTIRRYE